MTGLRTFATAWGATMGVRGTTQFRLWAPARSTVEVRTQRGPTTLRAKGDGWFEAEIAGLDAGEPYDFILDGAVTVPDPAARAQCGDVHGASKLIDPRAYEWKTQDWHGRPWHEAVLYELHVGTFTPEGTFSAAMTKLDHLANLGVTALELMPVAQFSGTRGWGYDGVLPYAPHSIYGQPSDLKALIDAAHARGLMVLLDVVYNHFGPDGNYLHLYAPTFFDPERQTPWGAGIAYQEQAVRRFFIDNAMYWLEEFYLDGLRLDAIDQIVDPSTPSLLEEIAQTVRKHIPDREIHLTTEDNRNITRLHLRDIKNKVRLYTAEWNDDFHNVAHVIATGEREGYYQDFSDQLEARLARALSEGFVYQGEPSVHAGGKARGEPSVCLPPIAFIDFLQNHDQIGNRALGERLNTLVGGDLLQVLTVITLLSPSIPMLFMGEEWSETRPFQFFTDFHGELAAQVREGRRQEFRAWSAFRNEKARSHIPDPNAAETFAASRIDWTKLHDPAGRARARFVQKLLEIRSASIVPRLAKLRGGQSVIRRAHDGIVAVSWRFDDETELHIDANLFDEERTATPAPDGDIVFSWPNELADTQAPLSLPGPSVIVRLRHGSKRTA